jgi:uncharacterized delta-60 repeat protein
MVGQRIARHGTRLGARTGSSAPTYRRLLALLAALLLVFVRPGGALAANDGTLDPAFNGTGLVTTNIGGGTASAVVLQPDGKTVVAGYSGTNIVLTRYGVDGSLDSAHFGSSGIVTTNFAGTDSIIISGVALQNLSGTIDIVVAGYDTNSNQAILARYTPAGVLDASFGTGGKVSSNWHGSGLAVLNGIAVRQSDNEIVVTGFDNNDLVVAGYTSAGVLDSANFGASGITEFDFGNAFLDGANAIAVQNAGASTHQGTLAVSGYHSDGAGNTSFAVARFTAAGGLSGKTVTPFSSPSDNSAANAVVIEPDDTILSGGFATSGAATDFALAHYSFGGVLDTTFGTSGLLTTAFPSASAVANGLALQADGKIVAAGQVAPAVGLSSSAFALARYSSAGVLDTSFGTNGLVTTNFSSGSTDCGRAVAINGFGILVAGNTTSAAGGSTQDFAAARYVVSGPPIVTLDPQNLTVVTGQAATFTASALGSPSPTVQWQVSTNNGATFTNIVGATSTTLTIPAASVTTAISGNQYHAVFTNSNGSATTAAATLTVNKAATTTVVSSSANPSAFGQNVTFTATISPHLGPVPTGTVTFKDGASTLGTGAVNASGVATFSTSSLSVANHTISAVYGGDSNFTGSTSPGTFQTVNKAATITTVTSSANPSVHGQSVTFTATVSATAPGAGTRTGTVFFKDGAITIGTGTVNASGVATFSSSSLALGSHSITAFYAGDANFTASTSPALIQTVNKSPTAVVLTLAPNPSVNGQMVTFTATVSAVAPGAGIPSGTVVFKDGATTITGVTVNAAGVATLNYAGLAVGTHSITASYSGDANFSGSTSTAITQTVYKAVSSVALAGGPNPSVYGQPVIFTATVSAVAPGAGTRTGSVAFKDGATTISGVTINASGVATLSYSGLSIGTHSITASYSGDGNFSGSTSSAVSQVVNQAATTTTVISSANPSVFGAAVTFSATVSAVSPGAGTRTGTVTFMDGAATLGTGAVNASGVATFSTSSLAQGSHTITAVYGGDVNFTGSTSAVLNQNVRKPTTTVVSSSANPAVVGQNVIFSATISPSSGPVPTGTVTFKDGASALGTGTVNGSGVAALSTSGLALGNHSITAVYGGDNNYVGSTSFMFSQTIAKAATTTVVTSSANPSVFGQLVIFSATVNPVAPGAGTPGGTVTFMDGASTLGTSEVNGSGVANFGADGLTPGSHSITAVYGGDSDFTGSTSPALSQVVNKASTTTMLASAVNPTRYGQLVTFSATVNPVAPGAGTPTGTVTFMDGASTLGTGTLSTDTPNGSDLATFSTSGLIAASHGITAVYGGDANFTGSTSAVLTQTVNKAVTTVALTSSPNPSTNGTTVTFTATISAVAPGAGIPTGMVVFKDGATTITGVTVNAAGVATLNYAGLAAGTHSITAFYSGDANFAGSSSTAISQVVN